MEEYHTFLKLFYRHRKLPSEHDFTKQTNQIDVHRERQLLMHETHRIDVSKLPRNGFIGIQMKFNSKDRFQIDSCKSNGL